MSGIRIRLRFSPNLLPADTTVKESQTLWHYPNPTTTTISDFCSKLLSQFNLQVGPSQELKLVWKDYHLPETGEVHDLLRDGDEVGVIVRDKMDKTNDAPNPDASGSISQAPAAASPAGEKQSSSVSRSEDEASKSDKRGAEAKSELSGSQNPPAKKQKRGANDSSSSTGALQLTNTLLGNVFGNGIASRSDLGTVLGASPKMDQSSSFSELKVSPLNISGGAPFTNLSAATLLSGYLKNSSGENIYSKGIPNFSNWDFTSPSSQALLGTTGPAAAAAAAAAAATAASISAAACLSLRRTAWDEEEEGGGGEGDELRR